MWDSTDDRFLTDLAKVQIFDDWVKSDMYEYNGVSYAWAMKNIMGIDPETIISPIKREQIRLHMDYCRLYTKIMTKHCQ